MLCERGVHRDIKSVESKSESLLFFLSLSLFRQELTERISPSICPPNFALRSRYKKIQRDVLSQLLHTSLLHDISHRRRNFRA